MLRGCSGHTVGCQVNQTCRCEFWRCDFQRTFHCVRHHMPAPAAAAAAAAAAVVVSLEALCCAQVRISCT